MSSSETGDPKVEVWYENGIVYNKYLNGVTVNLAIEAAQKTEELAEKHSTQEVPAIVIFENMHNFGFKVNFTQVGKIVGSIDFLNSIGDIWIVGASVKLRSLLSKIGSPFLANKIHYEETLEQAEKAAKESIS